MPPDALLIRPITRRTAATIPLPGSKSITNRALVLAALSSTPVTLEGALFSRDTRIMVTALRELGFAIETDENSRRLTLNGLAGKIPRERATIHVGNAGTVARFLTAMIALRHGGEYRLDGDAAMRSRPMSGLLNALVNQGAQILPLSAPPDASTPETFPFILRPNTLRGGEIAVDASASSQILSALLIAAPLARAPVRVRTTGATVSKPFVTMTLRMMRQFGCTEIPATGADLHAFAAPVPYRLENGVYPVEPDATAASYFLALPIAAPVSVRVPLPCESLQGDIAFAHHLAQLGLSLHPAADAWLASPPPTSLPGGDLDFNAISDTFLTLGALSPLLASPLTIRGVAHARHQETDRLLALAVELEKLGQHPFPDSTALRADTSLGKITLYPDRDAMRRATATAPVRIRTYEDHRLAMSFAILASHDLHGDGRPWLAIEDPACCSKTFPDFFQILESIHDAPAP
ncbi:MAG: 3-phosphoshikimate 1-carboxyvinyltransferase [Puniceicoccales bacterium]|jgi:3-phosphoshikimate 1-carboxyvinyltransferase|nr:3-phosphoshikimate 1-carboxyvinyltransferase [Puniceicoccales bacterium]